MSKNFFLAQSVYYRPSVVPGARLGILRAISLLEGHGNDNLGANACVG